MSDPAAMLIYEQLYRPTAPSDPLPDPDTNSTTRRLWDTAERIRDALTAAGWRPPEVGSEAAARASIRAALAEADVTQAELARRLDLSQKHVSQVLSGRAGLSLDMADRMLAAVGRGPLIGGTDAQ